jgi:hypothetical protein
MPAGVDGVISGRKGVRNEHGESEAKKHLRATTTGQAGSC